MHSADTEERLKAAEVKRVAIAAAGKLSEERQGLKRRRSWKRGYRRRGHRGADREPEARFRLAQKRLSRAKRDEAVAGSRDHCQQPAPHRPGEVSRTVPLCKAHPLFHRLLSNDFLDCPIHFVMGTSTSLRCEMESS